MASVLLRCGVLQHSTAHSLFWPLPLLCSTALSMSLGRMSISPQSNLKNSRIMEKAVIKRIKEVQSLASRSEFERQIFARFPPGCSADRIEEYQIEDDWSPRNVFIPNSKHKKHHKGAKFETDLYVKIRGDTTDASNVTLGDILKNVIVLSYCVLPQTDWKWQDTLVSNKWVFAEITECPRKLLDKSWQLERSFQQLIGNPDDVAAVILLVNGEESEFQENAKNLIKRVVDIRDELFIKDTVFVVGYTPFRSIYSEMANLKDEMAALKGEMADVNRKVDEVLKVLKKD